MGDTRTCLALLGSVTTRANLASLPQLRFNKVSELIHNSQNHRNLESARVTVYFQEIIDQVGRCLGEGGQVVRQHQAAASSFRGPKRPSRRTAAVLEQGNTRPTGLG